MSWSTGMHEIGEIKFSSHTPWYVFKVFLDNDGVMWFQEVEYPFLKWSVEHMKKFASGYVDRESNADLQMVEAARQVIGFSLI